MSSGKIPMIGIVQAVGLALCISIYNVYLRACIQLFDVQPVVTTGLFLLACAFVLTLGAGPGRLAHETLRSSATWVTGFIVIGLYLSDMFLMQYITGTEASLFSRMTVPLSLFLAWVFMQRTPGKGDWFGVPFIVLGLFALMTLQSEDLIGPLLAVAGFIAVMQTIEYFITETHREAVIAQQLGNLRDKARVIGFVTFSTSIVFMLVAFVLGVFKHDLPLPVTVVNKIPSPQDFAHPASIISALIFGGIILPVLRYFKWSATYNIKTENVFLFMAFIPVVTFLLEWLASFIPGYTFNTAAFEGQRGLWLIGITAVMTLGALISAVYKIKHQAERTEEISDLKNQLLRGEDRALASGFQPTAPDDFAAVTATLEQCGGNTKLAARLLDVPHGALLAVQQGLGRQAFHATVAARVARNFRQNVALADPLTGLQNRLHFMQALRQQLQSGRALTLLFIDLNKFKPVNDTYGHEAGDAVLKTIGQRLQQIVPPAASLARLGGDEFVVTLPGGDIKVAQKLAEEIKSTTAEPVLLTSDLPPVELGAAIGLARYPQDASTAEDLIHLADKAMYKNKGRR